MGVASSSYAYGDSDVAALRLSRVAEAFHDTTASFLMSAVREPPQRAVDLGCGPGFTTRLIAQVLHPRQTLGLDRSERFLSRARRGAPDGVRFAVHDATVMPLPLEPADLVYCRLLLSHLPTRADIVARWASQLARGGRLLLDEIEDVASDLPAFTAYLEIAQHVVAARGGRLFVGAELDAMSVPDGVVRVRSEIAVFHPPARLAADIFRLNLEVLAHDAVVVKRWGAAHLDELIRELAVIGSGSAEASSTWRVRQIAFRREG